MQPAVKSFSSLVLLLIVGLLSPLMPQTVLAAETKVIAKEQQDEDLWEEDLWQDESANEASAWTGFIEYGYGDRLSSDPLFSKQQTLNEARVHLQKDWSFNTSFVDFAGDLWYDHVLNEMDADIRELNLNFSAFGNTDFKMGRQIITWGTGDLLFLNDLFAKDWNAYFNGRDDAYLKKPTNAVRVSSHFDTLNLDLVWTPKFTPDDYIDGERFAFFRHWRERISAEPI